MYILKSFLKNIILNEIENVYINDIGEEYLNEQYAELEKSFFSEYWYAWVMLMFFTTLIIIYIFYKKRIDYKKIIEEKKHEIEKYKKNKEELEKQESLQKEISIKAMKAKNMILKNMGHEIRTPLNSIISICDIAQLSDLTLKQKNYIEDIKILANNLNLTINEIIEYSKIESGENKIEANRFNLEELVSDLISKIFQSGYRKGIEIGYYISKEVPINIKSDKGKLNQVLISLISNAIKYTDKGYVYIKIDVKKSSENRHILLFKILDTGKGMPESEKDIFLLESNSSQITYNYSRTGIGLPIAKKLVNLMDGDITYKSMLNKGTEFVFTIAAEEVSFDFVNLNEVNNLENKNILFIYENDINKNIMCKILQEKNIKVSNLKNNEVKIKLNNEILKNIDVIIYEKTDDETLDEFYREISIFNYNKNKIIVLVNPIEVLEKDLKNNKKYDYIIKPIKKHEVYSKLEKNIFNISSVISNETKKNIEKFEYVEDQISEKRDTANIYEEISINSNNSNLEHTQNENNPSILVVEDNETNRLTITTLLLKKGYNIIEATNGKEAVEAYEKHSNIKLILMDIQMPIMNGYEATEIILEKSKKENREINIIAVTAYVTTTDKERCFQIGMSDYMTKPFNFVELYEKISNYI